ncbi:transposase [Patescibacteria group bacterium]|nr:transposase [Patescibacteria group bacterium]MBU4057534.1 transposase [Patescibacteria group bacterium]MBU4115573.1 transposase [Patescibacteria group bacterium]
MRKTEFANGEYYHIFNRGVDKRKIFSDKYDLQRFFQSMKEFNTLEPIGSIYENSFNKDKDKNHQLGSSASKLVEFIAYCLNPNHYHFILKQVSEKGIEKIMHKLGGGFAKYFNQKYKRTGALFQGSFKAVHIDSNEQLLYVSSYVNLNFKVHQLGCGAPKLELGLVKSSWGEYVGEDATKSKEGFCKKDIILGQFKNKNEYKKYALKSLDLILENKEREKEDNIEEKKEIKNLFLE